MLNPNFGTVYQTTRYHTTTHYVCNLGTCLNFKANLCLDVPPTAHQIFISPRLATVYKLHVILRTKIEYFHKQI